VIPWPGEPHTSAPNSDVKSADHDPISSSLDRLPRRCSPPRWRQCCRHHWPRRQPDASAADFLGRSGNRFSPVPRGTRLFCCNAESGAATAAFSPPNRRWNYRATARGLGARNMVNRLCIDSRGPRQRALQRADNVKESYLTPVDHPINRAAHRRRVPVGATCAWVVRRRRRGRPPAIDLRFAPSPSTFASITAVRRLQPSRVSSGPGSATANRNRDQGARYLHRRPSATASPPAKAIPDRPGSRLADEGFCFRYYMGSAAAQYYRPSRGGYKGGRACESGPTRCRNWQHNCCGLVQLAVPPLALQLSDPHTALALAVQYPQHRRHLSAARLHRRHHRRRLVSAANAYANVRRANRNATCSAGVNGQLGRIARRPSPRPDAGCRIGSLDLVLAVDRPPNDIYFLGPGRRT